LANDAAIKAAAGCPGSIGPVGLAGRIIADRSAAARRFRVRRQRDRTGNTSPA
jgi:hypothetical protein